MDLHSDACGILVAMQSQDNEQDNETGVNKIITIHHSMFLLNY